MTAERLYTVRYFVKLYLSVPRTVPGIVWLPPAVVVVGGSSPCDITALSPVAPPAHSGWTTATPPDLPWSTCK